jgi:hypothetical protein
MFTAEGRKRAGPDAGGPQTTVQPNVILSELAGMREAARSFRPPPTMEAVRMTIPSLRHAEGG